MTITNKLNELKVGQNERVAFLADIPYSKVDEHIESLFSNLNAKQKSYLKKLTKLVLYLVKNNQT